MDLGDVSSRDKTVSQPTMSFCYNLLSVISLVPWRSLTPLSAQSLGKSGQKTLSQRVSLGDVAAQGRVQD